MGKNILFLCSEGMQRSPTAAKLFQSSKKYNADYAGLNLSLAKKPVTKTQIIKSDIIILMDQKNDKHKTTLLKLFPEITTKKQIIILDIPDIYIKGETELINILKSKLISSGITP